MARKDPILGDVVAYRLTAAERSSWSNNGAHEAAAIVSRVFDAGADGVRVNLRVMLDSDSELAEPWVTAIEHGDGDGQWQWPTPDPD